MSELLHEEQLPGSLFFRVIYDGFDGSVKATLRSSATRKCYAIGIRHISRDAAVAKCQDFRASAVQALANEGTA